MSFKVIVMYAITLILFILYITLKIKKRKYLFSFFNIIIFVNAFTLFFTGLFQYDDKAWKPLGIDSVLIFYNYINKVYFINLLGFSIFIIFLIYYELYKKPHKIKKIINCISLNINKKVINLLFSICLISWYVLVIKLNKNMPLFNGNRSFITNYPSMKPIYVSLNTLISGLALFYGCYFIIYKKNTDSIAFFVAIITMLFTGNRSPVIGALIIFILFGIYYRTVSYKNLKIFLCLIIILLIGVFLGFIRGGFNHNSNNILKDILYGNTFCDIRDGAFLLFNLHNKNYGLLHGKNYIADLISFIPSYMSNFREIWSYGNFTTNTLLGWSHHYGLRGGLFFEAFINFGYLGVFICSILYSYFMASFEILFNEEVIKGKKVRLIPFDLISYQPIYTLASSITISSAFHNFYVYVIILIGIVFISAIINNGKIVIKSRIN